jgi:hypothetical protein
VLRGSVKPFLGQLDRDSLHADRERVRSPTDRYNKQYLHKVPNGYCGLGGTGISCPVGVVKSER